MTATQGIAAPGQDTTSTGGYNVLHGTPDPPAGDTATMMPQLIGVFSFQAPQTMSTGFREPRQGVRMATQPMTWAPPPTTTSS